MKPLNYTYQSSRYILVAPSWWQKLELHNDAPLVTKKVITHFPLENSDPVNYQAKISPQKENDSFPNS